MAAVLEAPVPTGTRSLPLLKIGQLAGRSGITARNLRFYADAGVFGDLPRSPKGYRLFPVEAIHWVRILRAAQAAGFSLEEVRSCCAPCARTRPPATMCGKPSAPSWKLWRRS